MAAEERSDATRAAVPASRASARRAGIVGAAAQLIRTQGVHAASISEIIKASGSSAGSIYHHFANKNEIVLAVARAAVADPMHAMLERHAHDTLSPGELFREVVDTVLQGEIESSLIVQLWAGSAGEPQIKELLRAEMEDLRGEFVRHIERWLAAQGVRDAASRAEPVAMVTMGQAMGLLAQRTLVPALDRASYVVTASAMLDEAARAASGGRG